MKIHDFASSLAIGEQGETKVKRFLESKFAVVEDLRGSPEFQEKDIDFRAKGEQEYTFELKTDTYTNGNIFLETISAMEIGSKGWLYKTKADYLLYYYINFQRLFVLDMEGLATWFENEKPNLVAYRKLLKNTYQGGVYTTEGYAIPMKMICRKVAHKSFML